MIPDIGERPIVDDEWLARYLVHKEHVRADGTVKPDPFIPFKWVELSVTRHLGLEECEIWTFGEDVAAKFGRTLIGRADTQALVHREFGLEVVAAPLPENPNHADVVGWPADKPSQKEKALLIARKACFAPKAQE